MTDFLKQIVAHKRQAIADVQARAPLAELDARARARRDHRDFAAALEAPGVRVIAEIKRASPSKGDLHPGLDPAALARTYEAGGAAALSVLTEEAFFKGSPADLQAARQAVRLPVLRKDFILDPYQVVEAAAMGADAILLIVRLLDDAHLRLLSEAAAHYGLAALVEVHGEEEARRANRLGARLVAINNRDLARFDTDAATAIRVASQFAPGTCVVAASAIASAGDIRRNLAAGIRRFLVGESLVRSGDPASLLRAWTSVTAAEPKPAIEIKICGMTDPALAALAAEAGADAIGLVFHPTSPRHLTPARAREVAAAVPAHVARVGVFVAQPLDAILCVAEEAGLTAVQIYGACPGITVEALARQGLRLVKVLSSRGAELRQEAAALSPAAGLLVECGTGVLPGGNGVAWNWADAAVLRGLRPFAIAGGLTPDNAVAAIRASGASAIDLSSGVESRPGVKDPARIRALVAAVRAVSLAGCGPVFHPPAPSQN